MEVVNHGDVDAAVPARRQHPLRSSFAKNCLSGAELIENCMPSPDSALVIQMLAQRNGVQRREIRADGGARGSAPRQILMPPGPLPLRIAEREIEGG